MFVFDDFHGISILSDLRERNSILYYPLQDMFFEISGVESVTMQLLLLYSLCKCSICIAQNRKNGQLSTESERGHRSKGRRLNLQAFAGFLLKVCVGYPMASHGIPYNVFFLFPIDLLIHVGRWLPVSHLTTTG